MPTNRERRRDARLETILERAGMLLARDGLEGLTLQRLADECAITPAALYRYISSKNELITRLQAWSLGDLAEIVRTSVASWRRSSLVAGAPPRARPMIPVLALGLLYVRLRENDSLHIQLMSALVGDPRPVVSDDWAQKVSGQWMELLEQIAALISEAASAGSIDAGRPLERAALLWASMQAAAQTQKLRRLAGDLFSPRDMVLELGAGLLARWGARPADIDAAVETARSLRMRVPG